MLLQQLAKRTLVLIGSCVLCASALSAQAATVIGFGNSGGLPVENVLFKDGLIEGPALTVQGQTNSSGLVVDFTGEENLLQKASGQAAITAADGGFKYLLMEMHNGNPFTAADFNIRTRYDGHVMVTAFDSNGGSFSTIPLLALDEHGQNRIRVVAGSGEFIQRIVLSSDVDMQELTEVRLGGWPTGGTVPTPVVPVPAAAWMGLSLLGVIGAGRCIRRRQDA